MADIIIRPREGYDDLAHWCCQHCPACHPWMAGEQLRLFSEMHMVNHHPEIIDPVIDDRRNPKGPI